MDTLLLETLSEDAASPRAFRRFPLSVTIRVSLSSEKPHSRGASQAPQTPATLENASLSGLCFSSMTEFPPDALIQHEVEMSRQMHHVPAIVRRCLPGKRLGRTFYECGVQYLKSEATLRFLPCMAKHLMAHTSGTAAGK